MTYGRKGRVSIFLRSGLGLQHSRSYVQDWKTYENPNCLKLGHNYPRNKKNIYCRMGRRKLQTVSSTAQQRNLRGIVRWQWLLLKLEKDTALAMPCIVREDSRWKPQTCTPSIDAGEEPSDSENTAACGKGESKTYGPHCRKKGMWEAFTMAWYTSQFLFKKFCRNKKPKPPWINKREL